MYNLPIDNAYLKRPSILQNFLAKLRQALVPIEDQWTWTTRDGEFYEEVEVEDIVADEVIFRHKFGEARLPIALLSEDSRMKLDLGFEANHPQSEAAESKSAELATAVKKEKISGHLLHPVFYRRA